MPRMSFRFGALVVFALVRATLADEWRPNPYLLLDQTIILHASHMGNASSHSGDNLPIILAGGGFKHAGHIAGDRKDNTPLSNLYLTMLHQMGIEAEKFGASTGTISELKA